MLLSSRNCPHKTYCHHQRGPYVGYMGIYYLSYYYSTLLYKKKKPYRQKTYNVAGSAIFVIHCYIRSGA
jgi:hypothetical protein